MIDKATIDRIVARLLAAAPPGSKVILFGSHARGDADERSDVDLLVIEPKVTNRLEEMVRLRTVLRPLRIPVDLLVASDEQFEYWRDTPNTVFYLAKREGKVYESVA
ncbi:MAG: nucleotidyltransferase domain-containing protein [SAR324 cluster bacterium]|nr:nucleotidyltransferase domain-containing protein [SAR324 cluster bacterium]